MPMYDLACGRCGTERTDVLEPITAPTRQPCSCGGDFARVIRTHAAHGDEIDVEVKHGLCWPDGTPRRFRSQQELDRVAKRKGMINYVVHQGTKSGDKNKHTVRWVATPLPESERLKDHWSNTDPVAQQILAEPHVRRAADEPTSTERLVHEVIQSKGLV